MSDERRGEPKGVEYTVRDPETGAVLEIALKDGTRIYVAPPEPPPRLPREEDTERE
jgi:hypothetical protein